MRRVRAAVAGIAVAAMTLGIAAPAGAQEEPEALGFAVDKTQAQPGALVLGKANVGDVAQHCAETVEGIQERFLPTFELFDDREGELAQIFFPEGLVNIFQPLENHDQMAYGLLLFLIGSIAFNQEDAAAEVLPQTFVMTFADIATQEPVGERDNFDPNTGEGSVVVPDITPGLWAVAAACVGPSLDVPTLEAGIRAGGAFLDQIDAPVDALFGEEMLAFMQEFLDSDTTNELALFIEFLGAIGPDLLEPLMVPDAFGAVIFCILDPEGNCPDGEVEPPPGEPVPPPSEEPLPAQPVVAVPAFTG